MQCKDGSNNGHEIAKVNHGRARKLVSKLASISCVLGCVCGQAVHVWCACENERTMQQVGVCSYAHLILHLLETSGDFLLPFAHF